jgi:SnoaL-like domain
MELPNSLFVYRDAWNTLNADEIRPLLERSLEPDCLFVDPAHVCRGIGEIEAMIREFRAGFPASTYVLASGVDGHNCRYRYRWTAHLDEDTVVDGMDFTTVATTGLIERIDGFFGDFAPIG